MNDQQQKEIEDYLSGTSVRPPHGSVFDEVDIKSGPPMLRMIMLQMAFAFVTSFKGATPRIKACGIGLVCAFFLYTDMNTFMDKRQPNLYELVGFDRNSNAEFIEDRLELAKICDFEVTEEACSIFNYADD